MLLNSVFQVFFQIFGSHFGVPGRPKNQKNQAQFILLCPEGPLDRFGTTLGSILEQFRGHFELIFAVFSKMFSEVSGFV